MMLYHSTLLVVCKQSAISKKFNKLTFKYTIILVVYSVLRIPYTVHCTVSHTYTIFVIIKRLRRLHAVCMSIDIQPSCR